MFALPKNVPNKSLPAGPAADVAARTLLLKRTLVLLQPTAILGYLAGELIPEIFLLELALLLLLLTLSGSMGI